MYIEYDTFSFSFFKSIFYEMLIVQFHFINFFSIHDLEFEGVCCIDKIFYIHDALVILKFFETFNSSLHRQGRNSIDKKLIGCFSYFFIMYYD